MEGFHGITCQHRRYDDFGNAVAISGAYAVVGAHLDNAAGGDSGSAYVFARNSDGSWTQHAKLVAADAESDDFFGYDVAISGDYAVIGAYQDSTTGGGSGTGFGAA